MAVILRLKRQVVLPTIWLDRHEWRNRFARDRVTFLDLLDESSRTVLEDIGGFRGVVELATWWDRPTVRLCSKCGQDLPIDQFRLMAPGRVRPECRECERALDAVLVS